MSVLLRTVLIRKKTFSDSLGPVSDGLSQGRICKKCTFRHHRGGLFPCPVFCYGRNCRRPDEWQPGLLLLPWEMSYYSTPLDRESSFSFPFYREKPCGDLCGSRRDSKTLHGKAPPYAPRCCAGAKFRSLKKHDHRAD